MGIEAALINDGVLQAGNAGAGSVGDTNGFSYGQVGCRDDDDFFRDKRGVGGFDGEDALRLRGGIGCEARNQADQCYWNAAMIVNQSEILVRKKVTN